MKENEDIIYFAGYTDGDGCFSITSFKKKVRSVFCISAANFEIVSFLVKCFGGYCQNSKQKSHHKPVFQFRKYGAEACDFARQLFPYLIQRKKECELFISFFNVSSKIDKLEIISQLQHQHKEVDLISIDDIDKLKIVKSIEPTEEDFIYMAGFIDAECNFTISKYKPTNKPNYVYKIMLQLNDTKSPMFYWIKSRFGGFCCFYKRSEGKKNQITWRLTAKSLYPFLKKVYPYLRFKKPVCEKLIEFYETSLTNGGARHTEEFRAFYATTIDKRESIIQQVHFLNQKGL